MIILIVGRLGKGKTLCQTGFAYLFYNSGYSLYANYVLKKPLNYVNLDDVDDFLNIETEKNLYLLDEFWITADSRRSMAFQNMVSTQKILQSRKRKAHVILTAQDYKQIDVRIRNVTDLVLEPEIIEYADNKPLIMNVKYFLSDERKGIKEFLFPLYYDGNFICDMYDTFEVVESMNTGLKKHMSEIINKYKDYENLTKSELISLINMRENERLNMGLNKTNIKDAVDYIKLIQKEPELDILT